METRVEHPGLSPGEAAAAVRRVLAGGGPSWLYEDGRSIFLISDRDLGLLIADCPLEVDIRVDTQVGFEFAYLRRPAIEAYGDGTRQGALADLARQLRRWAEDTLLDAPDSFVRGPHRWELVLALRTIASDLRGDLPVELGDSVVGVETLPYEESL